MKALRDRIVRRDPFDTGEGKSGSALERVTLDDGRELVLKHEAPDDLVARVVPGGADRIGVLWDSGVLAHAATAVDHCIVNVERDGSEWLVFMRDVSHTLLPETVDISRAQHERIVQAIAHLHGAFRDEPLPELCPLATPFRMLAPATVAPLVDLGDFLPPLVARGWDLWPDAVPDDVADAVLAVHDRADDLAARLSQHESTLCHGDLRLANLGVTADGVVLIDWGALTAVAPPALDWAVYLSTDIQRIDANHDEFLDDVRVAEAERHDPEALSLALLGVLALMGWNKALDLLDTDDEELRARQRADLDWWVAEARVALEIWSPT
jgi:thiamine kinase-like enzyme